MFGNGALDSVVNVLSAQRDRLEDIERADRVQPKAHTGAISTSRTLTAFDYVLLVDATAGAVVLTLPPVLTSRDYAYTVKKIDNSVNAMTLDGDGGELIDNVLTKTTTTQYDVFRVVCDGAAWWLI